MPDRTLPRRRVLDAAGAAALLGLAGCVTRVDGNDSPNGSAASDPPSVDPEAAGLAGGRDGASPRGPRNSDDLPPDTTPNDGYPPEFDDVPPERGVNTAEFDALARGGLSVELVPTHVAYYWYTRGEARFVDARSAPQFEVSHVFGAVLSPAGDGRELPDDPVLEWPKDDRIITYCGCPHHLSSLRAASLQKRGYEAVYALDEGFDTWRNRSYPLAGSDVGRVPPVRVVEGSVPRAYAGRTAWAYHDESSQAEATGIAGDGSYELALRFVDVTAASPVRVRTPAYTLTEPVGRLTGGTVAPDGTLSG